VDRHAATVTMHNVRLTLSKNRLNRTALLVPAARWRACVQS